MFALLFVLCHCTEHIHGIFAPFNSNGSSGGASKHRCELLQTGFLLKLSLSSTNVDRRLPPAPTENILFIYKTAKKKKNPTFTRP